jgi:peroxiredoxin
MRLNTLCKPTLTACLLILLALRPVAAEQRLATLGGELVNWADYLGRGHWTLLMVWASNCPVCNQTIDEAVEFIADDTLPELKLLGVAIDGYSDRPGVDAFLERHAVNFPTLVDDGHAVAGLYMRERGVNWAGWTPTYLLFSPSGRLMAERVGPLNTASVVKFIREQQR